MPDNLAWNCTRSRKRCWRPPARLLGAETVLVGLRPEIAQTIIEPGLDFRSLVTRADLQSGVEYATHRQRAARQPDAEAHE